MTKGNSINKNDFIDDCRLTVILTSYNRLALLKVMMESLQKQSDSDFDLIICDNHSTDGSWLYINELPKFNNGNYTILHWDENRGWAGSAEKWNKYIKTDWSTIICDDDWLGIDFVKVINSAINEVSSDFSGLIISGHSRVDNEKRFEKEYLYHDKVLNVETSVSDFLNQKFDVAGISGFTLKTYILQSDFPKYYEGNGFLEDTLIIFRSLLSGGAKFTEGIHYFRREHSSSISASGSGNIYYRIALLRFKKDIKKYAQDSSCSKYLVKKLIKYNFIDHYKGIIKQFVIIGINLDLYNEYIKKIQLLDKNKYYQSIFFYPIILLSVSARKIYNIVK